MTKSRNFASTSLLSGDSGSNIELLKDQEKSAQEGVQEDLNKNSKFISAAFSSEVNNIKDLGITIDKLENWVRINFEKKKKEEQEINEIKKLYMGSALVEFIDKAFPKIEGVLLMIDMTSSFSLGVESKKDRIKRNVESCIAEVFAEMGCRDLEYGFQEKLKNATHELIGGNIKDFKKGNCYSVKQDLIELVKKVQRQVLMDEARKFVSLEIS